MHAVAGLQAEADRLEDELALIFARDGLGRSPPIEQGGQCETAVVAADGPDLHPPQGKIRVFGLHADRRPSVLGDPHFRLARLDDFDVGRQIADNLDAVSDRMRVFAPLGIGESQQIRIVQRRVFVVWVQLQAEAAGCLQPARRHGQPAAAGGAEIDFGCVRLDFRVRQGVDRDFGSLDGAEIAPGRFGSIGDSGIAGVIVDDAIDHDRRGLADFDRIFACSGIARRYVIAVRLLQSGFTRRQNALVPQFTLGSSHRDRLFRDLPVGRGID